MRLGNRAAHDARPLSQHDSVAAVSHLFQFCYWFARTYSRGKPPAELTFDPRTLPKPGPSPATTAAQIAGAAAALGGEELARQRGEAELGNRAELEAELEQLRAEVAEAKAGPRRRPTTTTTPRPRPATSSSTCCSPRRLAAGPDP